MKQPNNTKIELPLSGGSLDLETLGGNVAASSPSRPNIMQSLNDDDDDDDSYNEQEEIASLVAASVKQSRMLQQQQQLPSPSTAATTASAANRRHPLGIRPNNSTNPLSNNSGSLVRRLFGSRKSLRLISIIVLTFFILYLLSPSSSTSASSPGSNNSRISGTLTQKKHSEDGLPRYTCPSLTKYRVDHDAIPLGESDDQINHGTKEEDFNVWQSTFRERAYNRWGHTYNQVQQSLKDWTNQHVASYLEEQTSKSNNNDTVPTTLYDASLGVGLDMLMTLELLQQHNPQLTQGLTVYGNDVRPANVDWARKLLSQHLPKLGSKGGKLCAADTTHLHNFVPRHAFDVVTTGRIPPLTNPLAFKATQAADLERQYTALCAAQPSRKQQQQLQQAQAKQEGWYAKWTTELLRIAKPGGLIVLGHISLPLCQNLFDMGGVPILFWNSTGSTFVEQMDLGTLQVQLDTLVPNRYHVVFRKKKKQK